MPKAPSGEKMNKENEILEVDENLDDIKVLDSSPSPDEVEKMIQEAETDSPINAPDEDKAEGETEVEDQEPEVPQVPQTIAINDEYIANADEKDRNILKALKGETISPKALKTYIDAQRHIGKLGERIGQEKQNSKPIPDNIPQQPIGEQLQAVKQQEILNQLRTKFKDLPTDPEEITEYLAVLNQNNPDLYWDFREAKKQIAEEVDKDFNKIVYIHNNQKQINESVIANDIEKIKAELTEWGIEDPTKLGLNFDVDQSNQLISELLTVNGQLDPKIVTYYGNKPIINEGALYEKFIVMKRGLIRDYLKSNTTIKAKKEAFNELTEVKKKVNNTASAPKGQGSLSERIKSVKDIDRLLPQDIDALVEEENRVF